MPDDRKRPKLYLEGDVERSARHKRAPSATPIEIDPEETPPPREPPDPQLLDGFDALPPALQRQLIELWNTQREQDVGLVRLWDARHVPGELATLAASIGDVRSKLDRLANIPALLHSQGAAITTLITWKDERRRFDLKLDNTLEQLDRRLDHVEKEDIRRDAMVAQVAKDAAANSGATAKALDELREANAALDARVRSLEDDRIKYKAKAATVATLASMLVAFVAWLIGRFAK